MKNTPENEPKPEEVLPVNRAETAAVVITLGSAATSSLSIARIMINMDNAYTYRQVIETTSEPPQVLKDLEEVSLQKAELSTYAAVVSAFIFIGAFSYIMSRQEKRDKLKKQKKLEEQADQSEDQ